MRYRKFVLTLFMLAAIALFSSLLFSSIVSATGGSSENLTVDVMPEVLETKSGARLKIYVSVSEGLGEEVPAAQVTLSSDGGGSFLPLLGIADEEGFVIFIFTAPSVMTSTNVTINAKATDGNSEGQERLQ